MFEAAWLRAAYFYRLQRWLRPGTPNSTCPTTPAVRTTAALLTLIVCAASAENVFAFRNSGTTVGPPRPNSRLSKSELDMWNDPAFQKRFTESYIAETEVEPRVTVDEREHMQEVLELISSDKMDEAAEKIRKWRSETSSAVFDFTLANIYFQQDRLDEAAVAYKTAVERHAKFRRAWRNLALIYVRQGQFDQALPALIKAVELGAHDSVMYGLLGYSHSMQGNHLSAESAYRMAILLDPATKDWKMGLARSFFKQERFAEAVTLCKQLVADDPEDAKLWLLQANAYIGLKKPLEAAEIYELVDHLGKSKAQSLYMLGDIYINEELYDLAVNAYARAMKREPADNADRAIRSAKVLAARGAIDQTARLVEDVNDIYGRTLDQEDKKDLLKLWARIAVARGRAGQQVRVLEQIVKLDPLDGEALLLLGQHSREQEDYEKAAFYYERAAAIEEFEADAKVRYAQLLVGRGKYAEAIPLLQQAQRIKPRENVQKYLDQIERIAKSRN